MAGTESQPDGTDLDATILRWLRMLSDQWLPVDAPVLSSRETLALPACNQGSWNCRFPVPLGGRILGIWGANPRDRIRGTFLVSGGWQPADLTNRLRHHFVEWSQQPVTIQQIVHQRARLLTLIETRGEGGLVLCDPTPGYHLQQGTYFELPVLTAAERDLLLTSASSAAV